MSLIEDLNWRHACKAYDPTKKVSQEDLDKIIEAARLAPTSSGLQPFKVIVLKDSELRDQIAPTALNADCVRECSHILVFAAWDRYTAERIDTMYDLTTDHRDLPRGRFASYTDKLKEMYLDEAADANFAHIARQTYIALGLALAQAAELKIDSTPAEGFDNAAVDRVLGLEELGLKSVSLLYIGYADKERDWLAPMKKVRWPSDEFVLNM